MHFLILSIILQVGFVVHIVKTGRNTTWIWIVVMLPMAGALAYFIVEILPGLMGGSAAIKIRRNLQNTVNPDRDINTAERNYNISDTVENTLRLAEQCLNKNMFEEAKKLYEKCLTGINQDSPSILYGVAQAEYGMNNFSRVKELLDDLIEKNPEYQNPDAHLLYAKTADKLDDIELALKEYKVLDGYYRGPEAKFRYARLLQRIGDHEQARQLFGKIIEDSKISGRHYYDLHKQWIKWAKDEYGG